MTAQAAESLFFLILWGRVDPESPFGVLIFLSCFPSYESIMGLVGQRSKKIGDRMRGLVKPWLMNSFKVRIHVYIFFLKSKNMVIH